MSRLGVQAQRRICLLHARQHVTHVLHFRAPGAVLEAVSAGEPKSIADALLRAQRRGFDAGPVLGGALRALLAARGSEAIEHALAWVAEVATASLPNCTPDDELAVPDAAVEA